MQLSSEFSGNRLESGLKNLDAINTLRKQGNVTIYISNENVFSQSEAKTAEKKSAEKHLIWTLSFQGSKYLYIEISLHEPKKVEEKATSGTKTKFLKLI